MAEGRCSNRGGCSLGVCGVNNNLSLSVGSLPSLDLLSTDRIGRKHARNGRRQHSDSTDYTWITANRTRKVPLLTNGRFKLITLYSKYRRQNLRNAWSLADMNSFVLRCVLVAVVVITVLAVLGVIHDLFEEKEKHEQALKKVSHVESVIVGLLNHKGFFINDELHVCAAGNTWIKKGESL